MADRPRSQRVVLARLYQKESTSSGSTYFVGRMGAARLLLFHDKRADNKDPVWNLLAEEILEDEAPQKTATAARPVTVKPNHLQGEQLKRARASANDWQAPSGNVGGSDVAGGDFFDDDLPEDMKR